MPWNPTNQTKQLYDFKELLPFNSNYFAYSYMISRIVSLDEHLYDFK